MKNFDSPSFFFFFFFNKKNSFFSRSFVYFLLSLLLFQRKKTVSHFAPSFLPRERDDRQTRSHALSEEPLMRPTRERDREGIARSLSDSLLSSVLKREDFFFCPFRGGQNVFLKNVIDEHHKCTTCISKGENL